MKSIVAMQPETTNQEIQVSGLRCFSENHWREAILYYLNGVWSNKQDVMYRPKIAFGDITLRLHVGTHKYFAYTNGPTVARHDTQLQTKGKVLDAIWDQTSVEVGLVRFVKDDGIYRFVIHFGQGALFSIQKTMKRGEYVVVGTNLPSTDDAAKFYNL